MTINYGALAGIAGLTSALNFAGGITASNVSSRKAKKLAAYQAELNYKYNKKWAQESPSLSRTGLETAGYNPMLAVQNGTTGGNASSFASPNTANDVDLGLGSGFSNAMEFQNMQNQTEQAKSNVKLNESLGRKYTSEAVNTEIKNSFLPTSETVRLNQFAAATDKLVRETAFYDALEDNMQEMRRLDEMGINVDALSKKYAADKGHDAVVYNANSNKEIADKHSPSGRSASFENYTKGVQNVLNGVGSIIHGYNETNNYNGSNESETVYYDKNGNVRGSVSHKGSNKGSSNKSRKRR